MRILVLNGSYRKEGDMSAMAKASCAGARGVYGQAEGIYRTYLVDWFGAQDLGIYEATTSEAKFPEMVKKLHDFGASL